MEKLLTFDVFGSFSEIIHFCTTRHGGVSTGNFASFNLSPFVGDRAENFQNNLHILSKQTGISAENFIFPYQTHSEKILIIDSDFLNDSADIKKDKLQGVDAVITNAKNICIGVTTADCVPILLFDRNKKVIAAVHAGWRGTQALLVKKVISCMNKKFSSNSQNIYALIGPSISAEVYEVGSELITLFEKADFDVNSIFSKRNGKLFLNLWEANRQLLIECGVPSSQIQISGICTYIQHQNFFSARSLGIDSGRMFNGIILK